VQQKFLRILFYLSKVTDLQFLEGLESVGAVCFVFSPFQPIDLHSEMKKHSANVLDKNILHVFKNISRPLCILNNNTA